MQCKRKFNKHFSHFLSVTWIFCIAISSAYGSSYRLLNIEEVVNSSEVVFEGRVIHKEYKIPADRNRVYTYLTFEVLDVIKGNYNQQTIELRFPGGIIGDMVYRISNMSIPDEAEHGIYFVKSLKKRFVHPLTGWSQGHMLVVKDHNGTDRILSSDRKPITGIRPEPASSRPIQEMDSVHDSAPIVSRGVITSDQLNIDQALSVIHTKSLLEKLITGEP